VLREILPGLSRVSVQPGSGDIEDNLAGLAHAVLDFYQQSIPMLGVLLADPQRAVSAPRALAETLARAVVRPLA
jgi:hypothetical protein